MAAHLLIVTIRTIGLEDTELANAQASTLRARLFKVGALITISVRPGLRPAIFRIPSQGATRARHFRGSELHQASPDLSPYLRPTPQPDATPASGRSRCHSQ